MFCSHAPKRQWTTEGGCGQLAGSSGPPYGLCGPVCILSSLVKQLLNQVFNLLILLWRGRRAAWPLVARTLLALVIPCEQVGNAYVVELVQRQQQSGFGIDPQFEVNSSMMVAACGSSVSSSMQLCVSSGA